MKYSKSEQTEKWCSIKTNWQLRLHGIDDFEFILMYETKMNTLIKNMINMILFRTEISGIEESTGYLQYMDSFDLYDII